MRNIVITCKMSKDESEFYIVASIDGKKVKSEVEYCLGDALSRLNSFQHYIYDYYQVDTRYDAFKIKCNITLG